MDIYEIASHTKKSVGTRPYLEFFSTIYDSHARKDTDEFGTETLSEHSIKQIVEACNETGYPAIYEIKFKLKQNSVYDTITIPILPTVLNQNIEEFQARQKYAYYLTPELILKQTKKAQKQNAKEFKQSISEQIESIKEYIRMELIIPYLKLTQGSYPEIKTLDFIKNMTIVREKYDLDQISKNDIKSVRLNCSNFDDFDKILYDYAIRTSRDNANNNTVELVYGNQTNVVGLKKPKTYEELKAYASEIKSLFIFRKKIDESRSFMDEYKRRKAQPCPDADALFKSKPEDAPQPQ